MFKMILIPCIVWLYIYISNIQTNTQTRINSFVLLTVVIISDLISCPYDWLTILLMVATLRFTKPILAHAFVTCHYLFKLFSPEIT